MMHTRCASCGAGMRIPLRPGPSGALRIGAMPVSCRACGKVSVVRMRDVAAPGAVM